MAYLNMESREVWDEQRAPKLLESGSGSGFSRQSHDPVLVESVGIPLTALLVVELFNVPSLNRLSHEPCVLEGLRPLVGSEAGPVEDAGASKPAVVGWDNAVVLVSSML